MIFLKDLPVLVLGLGASGLAMARWCARWGADVTVWDSREHPPQAAALQAEVTVYADGVDVAAMPGMQDELRFLFITSSLAVQPASSAGSDATAVEGTPFKVLANVSKHGKCVRCWHYVESVGQDPHDPELCERCIENVNGGGEMRRYF